MFSFQKPSIYQTPKCFVTYGTMSYPDPDQLPTKAKPWSTLLSQDYVHKVRELSFDEALSQQHAHTYQIDLILPEALLRLVKEKILDDTARIPSYQRVIMTLGQVLEGDFFTQYIKIGVCTVHTLIARGLGANFGSSGNIMMLSEGKISTDNVFSIKDGMPDVPP